MTWKLVIKKPSSLMKNPDPNPPGVRTWTTASPSWLTNSRTERSGGSVLEDWNRPDLVSVGGVGAVAVVVALVFLPAERSGVSSLAIFAIWLRGTSRTV